MKEYISYKTWWIATQAPSHIGSLYYGNIPETAFEQHIKDLGLYRLMETLARWTDE